MHFRATGGIAVFVVMVAASGAARADEGMWTFDAFPTAKVKAGYGWAPDQPWLDRVQASAVRLTGGCSASFVSRNGLMLTNHHCVQACVQEQSSAETDYITNGFVARDRAKELQCAGQQAEVVTAISDVTARVRAAIGQSTGAALIAARNGTIATIEASTCTDRETTRCEVVTLFGGGRYTLYRYRTYSDVRLVWAPELAAAAFGGDPDNFSFPRYNIDAAFLRAYENGKPIATSQHLPWNARAPQPDEPTFVIGNPGRTLRLITADQRNVQRSLVLPFVVSFLSEYRGRLITARAQNAERFREGFEELASIENSYKALRGELQSLNDETFATMLDAQEAQLRSSKTARLGRGASDDPWQAIAKADRIYRDIFYDRFVLEQNSGFQSTLYGYAKTLVRAAAERDKPDAERLPGYTQASLPLTEKQLLDAAPVYPWLEQLQLEFWLSKTREYLGADSPAVRRLLGRDSPERLAATLVAGTKLADPAVRQALFTGGMAAIRASDDPLIRLVLANDATARAVRERYIAEVDAPISAAQARLTAVRFAAYGDDLYPDATFTLRISYGKVAGWVERGQPVPPTTRFAGLFDRATGQDPFQLATAIDRARSSLSPATTLDFATTNDITGGNSGSPVVARDGSVIGAIFDGNLQSLGGTFGYDASVNRSVAVSTAAIEAALQTVYPAPALLAELHRG
jgi:hypothetical protein